MDWVPASLPTTFSVSGNNLTAGIIVTAPTGFEVSTSSGSGYAARLTWTPSGGTEVATTIYVRLTAVDAAGTYSVNTFLIPSTATGALCQSSAGSTGRLSTSSDGTLLAFTEFEDGTGVTDETSITARGVGKVSVGYSYSLSASYTSTTGTGDQTRGATSLDNSRWYMSDKSGIYLNGSTIPANSSNIRPLKSIGGQVYVLSVNTTAVVPTVFGNGTTSIPRFQPLTKKISSSCERWVRPCLRWPCVAKTIGRSWLRLSRRHRPPVMIKPFGAIRRERLMAAAPSPGVDR